MRRDGGKAIEDGERKREDGGWRKREDGGWRKRKRRRREQEREDG